MNTWLSYISHLHQLLLENSVRNAGQEEIGSEAGFSMWKDLTLKIRQSGNRVFFIGNGASASMASHFAADLAKSGQICTEIFTDSALLTAIANDISYEEVFAEPLRLSMKAGDMLVAISSSGNSPNIVRAVEAAGNLGGIVVTLSAMDENNRIRKMGDLNFYVPCETYGLAESGHAAILHYWLDFVVTDSNPSRGNSV